ncbi:nuclear transport factor 2 family protein [Gilvibacter sediminis]|uniref:nuclear transport factor 2 family protein n=1 Tax=Gilvibacter sediminis TaxID=379071 RepID=UPI002350C328|nr:nuclear transport factor 2 family protein [Gilvibacter sediminis]MDC7998309.1 nuclear transport factor 2 family protein [Gilvibacter sediminis]
MKTVKHTLITLIALSLLSCGQQGPILEVTTFKINDTADLEAFIALDETVEDTFTSKQPGFLKRQSALNEEGQFVVLVYWESEAEAAASMDKFMNDTSVADYASMIDGRTINMARYQMPEGYSGKKSEFIEIMSFQLNNAADPKAFEQIDQQVAQQVTAPKTGFVQRISGLNKHDERVVVIYWDTKANSDAALQPFMNNTIAQDFMGMMDQSTVKMGRYSTLNTVNINDMQLSNKDKTVALLNSFNTGDTTPISYINPEKYIQHNLAVGDGLAGFGEVMKNAPEGGFKANVVRAFQDGDYVFTHTEYDFFGPKAGFDVFRFEDGLIVEHWDNLLEVQDPNPSGHTQFDGATAITDLDKTEANKAKVEAFITDVLLNHQMEKVTDYISTETYIQHNPAVADGLEGFGAAMKYFAENGLVMEYTKLVKVLGEGNFVLTLSEGKFGKGELTAFYDLFRLENGLIVEHWDVISPIPPKEQWANENGKW